MSATYIYPTQITTPSIVAQQGVTKPVSYVIYSGSGGNYYAENGRTGNVDYSGTNAAAVIQAALNNTSQGTVLVKAAVYSVNTQLTIPTSVTLMGEGTVGDIYGQGTTGVGATSFTWGGSANTSVIKFSTVKNAALRQVNINMNNTNGANGVELYESNECVLEDVTVMYGGSNSVGYLIDSAGATYGSLFNHLTRCKALGVTTFMSFSGTSSSYATGDNVVTQCDGQACTTGIQLVKYSDHNYFWGLHVRLNEASGIGVVLNSDSPTNERGVYMNYFFEPFFESNQNYTAIQANYNGGNPNYFIKPIFEKLSGVTVTPLVTQGSSHTMYIDTDSITNTIQETWGGFISLPYSSSVITQNKIKAYIPSGTNMAVGLNSFTFLSSLLTGDGNAIVLVHGIADYDGNPKYIGAFYGFDNSASVANQGIVSITSTSAFTTSGQIQLSIIILRNTT